MPFDALPLTALPLALIGGPNDDPKKTTPENEMGPFYKKGAPTTSAPPPGRSDVVSAWKSKAASTTPVATSSKASKSKFGKLTTMVTLQSPANVVAIGYSGSNLIGACTDGKIKIWTTDSATLLHPLPGHNAITLSCWPVAETIIRLASGTSRPASRNGPAPKASAEAQLLLFSPDASTLLSANSDTDLRIWRTPNGELSTKIVDYPLSMFAADYSGADRSIYIWDARGSKLARTLTGISRLIGSLDDIRQASRDPGTLA